MTTPITHSAMARACFSGGLMSSSTACDIGISAAPQMPCNRRAATISGKDCAKPHSAEATVKPTMDERNTRRRPTRPASQPLRGVMMAAAMM